MDGWWVGLGVGGLVGWLAGLLVVARLVCWCVARLVGRLIVRLVVGCRVGWWFAWLFGWMVVCLDGRLLFVDFRHNLDRPLFVGWRRNPDHVESRYTPVLHLLVE